MISFEITSELKGSLNEVWSSVTTLEGVNYELMPWARMSAPKAWLRKPLFEWPMNQFLFTSVIYLFGFIPSDFHKFRLLSINHEGFQESSTSLLNRFWMHRRTINPSGTGCAIVDRIECENRIWFLEIITGRIYKVVFQNRHNKLRKKFGKK